MRLVIKGTSYDYEPDYPKEWISTSVDFFKCPVDIGNHTCFIKRFEKKMPSEISGWDLLVMLKKEYEPNLTEIYDIKSVEEKGKRIYYIFYEYLKGHTLDKLIGNNVPVDLISLTKDLFQAIKSLQNHDYWFANFFEKNIFLEESGRFVLVDLDSAQPISKRLAGAMEGGNNYSKQIFDFYTTIVNYRDFKKDDLPGIALNHLQIIFLILRLKILSGIEQRKENAEMPDNLHVKLNEIDSSFKELFTKVYSGREGPQHLKYATEIEQLIIQKIIGYKSNLPIDQIPVINDFTATTYTVGKEGGFELRWKVKNATYVELYEDEALDTKFTEGETSIKKTAFYDGGKEAISYKLIAYRGEKKAESAIINIQFNESSPELNDLRIEKFSATPNIVENGKNFELSWKVKGASHIELYENDVLDSEFTSTESSVKKTAFYDGGEEIISYKLIAYIGNKKVASDPIDIKFKEHIPDPVNIKIEEFIANPEIVKNEESFELSWKVQDASYVELYKNDMLDTKFTGGKTSVKKMALYDNGTETITYKLIAYKGDIEEESGPVYIRKPVAAPPIKIEAFATPDTVANGESFKLNWDVKNAKYVELYINGVLESKFNAGEKEVTKTARFDGTAKINSCKLIAYSDGDRVESELIIIKQRLPAIPPRLQVPVAYYIKRIGASLLGLLIIGALIKWPSFRTPARPLILKDTTSHPPDTISDKNVTRSGSGITPINNIPANDSDKLKKRYDSVANLEKLRKRKEEINKIAQAQEARARATEDSTKKAEAAANEIKANMARIKKAEEDRRAIWESNKYNLVVITPTSKSRLLGGVKDVKITVKNNSDYHLEVVLIKVIYLKGKSEKENHTLKLSNINPHDSATLTAPNGRGGTVKANIDSIKAKDFN